MKKLIRQKIFISAFLTTYFLFFATTIYILDLKKPGFGVGSLEYGFPFVYYYSHCFGGYYLWSGLAGNILTAGIFSLMIGSFASQIWLKFSAPEFRAKWRI